MTLINRLRLPARAAVPSLRAQAFHYGRPDGASTRPPGQTLAEAIIDGANEMERTGDVTAERIIAKRREFPRLVHSKNPISVPTFRQRYDNDETGRPPRPGQEQEPEQVTVYGRVESMRRLGAKLVFLTILNEFERVQVMVNFQKCRVESGRLSKEDFLFFARLVERGDHISVTGSPTRTPTGELTIQAVRLPDLVAPASEPIPERMHDDKGRMRRRHVDMLVNRRTTDTLRLRSRIIRYMREFFHERNFLEFQTPILGENAGGAVARPFTTTSTELSDKELALRVAPELWLKRLVVGGVDRVFEIGPAFRNEGIDRTHNPEFTICEFYSAYANLEDLVGQTEELVSGLATHCRDLIASGELASLPEVDVALFEAPFRRVEFVPELEARLGIALPDLEAESAYEDLAALLRGRPDLGRDLDLPENAEEWPASLAKLLDHLAATCIESQSRTGGPLFVTHHPACMSPLAKSFVCPKTGQLVAARAELFVRGRELANMYEEENDPVAQERKLAGHRRQGDRSAAARREVDSEAAPLDRSYVAALRAGLPPTGGWGCGVERLVMLFSGAERIAQVLSFGSLRNVVGLTSGDGELRRD